MVTPNALTGLLSPRGFCRSSPQWAAGPWAHPSSSPCSSTLQAFSTPCRPAGGHRHLRVLGKPALTPRGWAHTRLQPVHPPQGAAGPCSRTSGSCIQSQPRCSPDVQPRAEIYPPSSPRVNPGPDPQGPAPHRCRQPSIKWN